MWILPRTPLLMGDLQRCLCKLWTRKVGTGATTKRRAQSFGIVLALIVVCATKSEQSFLVPIATLYQGRRGGVVRRWPDVCGPPCL